MKIIKLFEEYYQDFEIDDIFINELEKRELWQLNNDSLNQQFNIEEVYKLNLFFGVDKKPNNITNYQFQHVYGSFGTPVTQLTGQISKKFHHYDQYTFYLLDIFIKMKVGSQSGKRHATLKFLDLKEVLEFINSFQQT